MLQATKLIAQGRGLAPVLLKRAATVALDWNARQKSRFDTSDSAGRRLSVLLPQGTVLQGGDVLVVEDGSMVKVVAASQAVLRITACKSHGSPFDLSRAAYHLGKRNVAVELKPDHLKIEPDPVLANMLSAMHLDVVAVEETFEPEGEACRAGSHGEHGEHPHAHSHAPAPAEARLTPAPAHVHGPDCKHEHGPSPAHGHDHDHGRTVSVQFHASRPPRDAAH